MKLHWSLVALFFAPLLLADKVNQAQILAMNHLVEADLDVPGDGFRFPLALAGHLVQERPERFLQKRLFEGRTVGSTMCRTCTSVE